MPEPPIRELIAAVGEIASAAGSLAAEALAQLRAGPPGPAASLMALALLENRAAQDRARLTLLAAQALWEEGEAAGRAKERAALEAAPPRLHPVRVLSPQGKKAVTVR